VTLQCNRMLKYNTGVMTITNQNLIHEEIKNKLNWGNSCYFSVQKILFPLLPYKNVRIKIYKTII
jgi:hypothetical protein